MKKWDEIIEGMDSQRKMEVEIIREKARMVSDIIAAREALGITQEQLGRRVGMKQSQIARFEGGTTAPSIDTIMKIAFALGLRVGIMGNGCEEAAATALREPEYA